MESHVDQVVASYHRARQSGHLFDTFYELFLSKSPEIPAMFAHTDFKHQKLMLRESLLEMLLYDDAKPSSKEIARLAERHQELNVKPEHYELWLAALCEALAAHDPQFTPDLEQKWQDAMRPGIKAMLGE